jgi:hypothetical protein
MRLVIAPRFSGPVRRPPTFTARSAIADAAPQAVWGTLRGLFADEVRMSTTEANYATHAAEAG